MNGVINWLLTNILDVPCIFMAIIAAVGMILQRKKVPEIIEAALLTSVGYAIFNASLNLIFGPMTAFNLILQTAFNVSAGVTPNSDAMVTVAYTFTYIAANIMQIFIIAWLIHVMIVKIFHKYVKVVYLTVHAMLDWVAINVVFWHLAVGFSGIKLYVASIICCVLYWTLTPMLVYKECMELTDGAYALGHLQSVGCWIVSKVSHIFGDPEKDDAEALKLPDWIQMFSSSTLNLAISMPVIFILIALVSLIIGNAETVAAVNEVTGNMSFVAYFFVSGIQFAGGVTILLTGIRMFLGSLIPAFQGFSEKMIPGCVPAVDLAAFFSIAPTAALLGFIGYAIGGILVAAGCLMFKTTIFVFPFILVSFFDGGVLAVFANHKGGWKASLVCGFIAGIFAFIGSGIYAALIPEVAASGTTCSNIDPAIIMTIMGIAVLKLKSFLG